MSTGIQKARGWVRCSRAGFNLSVYCKGRAQKRFRAETKRALRMGGEPPTRPDRVDWEIA